MFCRIPAIIRSAKAHAAATINNIGPGLATVGPTASFAHMTDLSKWVLIFDMLAGRLELFPMLILFHPTIWKQAFQRKGRRQAA